MSTPTVNPAQPWYPPIDQSISREITRHLQNLYSAINDHDKAITLVNGKITTVTKVATTATAAVVPSSSSSSSTSNFSGLGSVNNQTGNTAYTVQQTDNGALIVIDDASPVAVTLNSVVTSPYFCFITNLGAGLGTLTPTTGTVNGAGSFPLPQNYTAIVVFSASNWWATALPIVPVNTPAVAHEFFTAYNAVTGAFTAVQPTAADVVPASSTTGGRPVGVTLGFMDFDTTLGIPIWWNGTAWVNATGGVV